jgi:hypothetical protein
VSFDDNRIYLTGKLWQTDYPGQFRNKTLQEGLACGRQVGVIKLESKKIFRHKDQKTEGVFGV